jgi:copper chaperone CopZ
MSTHTYKFNVAMSCGGCSGAVERVLKKLDGELSPRRHSALATAAR